tara:strand:- start:242 stop:505 length:264 start_codon:yes stop_codon:yes gene_type:complete
MQTVFKFFLIIFILSFFYIIYIYYLSSNNLKVKKFNRDNINQIIQDKISNLPVLNNDTNNVIEFNNSVLENEHNEKPRSFWKLLKSK